MSEAKVCVVFPGQGSQFVGMGKAIANTFPQSKQIFEEASDTLSYDLQKICFEDPDKQLHLTEYTQPSILTVSIAIFQALKTELPFLQNLSKQNVMMAGHSLGEYSALVATGTINFTKALSLVKQRGHWMQEAVKKEEGGMVACLGISAQEVLSILKTCRSSFLKDQVLEVAAYNAPLQTILSGHQKALCQLVKTDFKFMNFSKAPKFFPIKVSAPFHCSLMQTAQDHIAPLIDRTPFQSPYTEIVPNALAYKTSDTSVLKQALREQITKPVQWLQSIESIRDLGYKYFIEIGPGRVLSSLLKHIDRNLKGYSIHLPEDINQVLRLMF